MPLPHKRLNEIESCSSASTVIHIDDEPDSENQAVAESAGGVGNVEPASPVQLDVAVPLDEAPLEPALQSEVLLRMWPLVWTSIAMQRAWWQSRTALSPVIAGRFTPANLLALHLQPLFPFSFHSCTHGRRRSGKARRRPRQCRVQGLFCW